MATCGAGSAGRATAPQAASGKGQSRKVHVPQEAQQASGSRTRNHQENASSRPVVQDVGRSHDGLVCRGKGALDWGQNVAGRERGVASVIQPVGHPEKHGGSLILHVQKGLLAAVLRWRGHGGQQFVERFEFAGRTHSAIQNRVRIGLPSKKPCICAVIDGDVRACPAPSFMSDSCPEMLNGESVQCLCTMRRHWQCHQLRRFPGWIAIEMRGQKCTNWVAGAV